MDIESKKSQWIAGSERETLLDYYWRKGIPSMVLAIVTLILTGYSYWYVQPNIQQRYRDICITNFDALGDKCDELKPYGDVKVSEMAIDTDSANLGVGLDLHETPNSAIRLQGTDERRRVLEQTHLSLRRLIHWDKTEDSVRFQSARVSELLAEWFLHRARSMNRDESTDEELSALVAGSRSEWRKATEAMRVVKKLNGPFSDKATLWLARRQLQDNVELSIAELDSLADQVAKIVDRDPSNAIAHSVLIELRVCQALRYASPITIGQRQELLRQADAMFQASPASSILELGWATEAKSLADSDAAQAIANLALKEFWAGGNDNLHSVDTLAAVFQSLVFVNSIWEAQLFLSERLPQISSIDQSRFRGLTAAACLRHVVLNAVRGDHKGRLEMNPRVNPQVSQFLFAMAIQLNPESNEILSMLESIAKPTNESPISVGLKEELGLIGSVSGKEGDAAKFGRADELGPSHVTAKLDVGLKPFLIAIVGLGAGAVDDSTANSLKTAIKVTPAYAIIANRFAMQLNSTNSVSTDEVLRWLRTINAAAPDVLVAWSDRASLHLKEKQFVDAIECYEFLLEKLPGNEPLSEALDSAKKQLQIEN